nr:hypothetical protein CFP56_20519 [Quercus suber]
MQLLWSQSPICGTTFSTTDLDAVCNYDSQVAQHVTSQIAASQHLLNTQRSRVPTPIPQPRETQPPQSPPLPSCLTIFKQLPPSSLSRNPINTLLNSWPSVHISLSELLEGQDVDSGIVWASKTKGHSTPRRVDEKQEGEKTSSLLAESDLVFEQRSGRKMVTCATWRSFGNLSWLSISHLHWLRPSYIYGNERTSFRTMSWVFTVYINLNGTFDLTYPSWSLTNEDLHHRPRSFKGGWVVQHADLDDFGRPVGLAFAEEGAAAVTAEVGGDSSTAICCLGEGLGSARRDGESVAGDDDAGAVSGAGDLSAVAAMTYCLLRERFVYLIRTFPHRHPPAGISGLIVQIFLCVIGEWNGQWRILMRFPSSWITGRPGHAVSSSSHRHADSNLELRASDRKQWDRVGCGGRRSFAALSQSQYVEKLPMPDVITTRAF